MTVKNRAAKLARHKRSCPAKQKFANRECAVTAFLSFVRSTGADKTQFEVYRCLACTGYHWGHCLGRGGHRR